jgi:hypothetical protein
MKIINVVLGLGTAIIVSSLIVLGISAFYPAPTYPTYPVAPVMQPCAQGDVNCVSALQNNQTQAENTYQTQETTYEAQTKVYNRNLFIVANIVGIVVFMVAFWLLFATSIVAQSVPIGIMIAGLYSIIYGYVAGWGSVDEKLKFFIGLVIGILVIGGSMWLIERYAKARGAKS